MFTLSASDRMDRGFFLLLAFLSILFCLKLDSYPLVWVDEPWESITAYTLATEGKIYNPVLEGRAGWDEVFLEPRMLLNILVGGMFFIFGPGVIQGRFVSVLFGLLLVTAVYAFGKRIFPPRAALMAAWCLGIETIVYIGSRTIRPDVYIAFFDVTVILLLLQAWNNSSREKRHFGIAGVITGIALWTHPNAFLILASTITLFLVHEGRAILSSRRFWIFSAAVTAAFLPYALYVVVQDADHSFSRFWLQLAGRPEDVVQSGWILTSLEGELKRILDYMRFPYRLPVVLTFLAALVWAVRSAPGTMHSILLVIAVHIGLSVLLLSNKTVLYASSILPFFALLCGAYFDRFIPNFRAVFSTKEPRRGGLTGPVIALLLLGSYSATQLGGTLSLLWDRQTCSYARVVDELQLAIPRGARVWGSMTFWFAFREQPYRTQYTYLRELESFRPEYMILGDKETESKDHWADVRRRVEELTHQRGTQTALIQGECYGELRIYKMTWE